MAISVRDTGERIVNSTISIDPGCYVAGRVVKFRALSMANNLIRQCISIMSRWRLAERNPNLGTIVHMRTEFVQAAGIAKYLDFVHRVILPHYANTDGMVSVSVLQRDLCGYSEVMILSSWDSRESLDHFLSRLPALSLPDSLVSKIPKDPLTFEVVV